MQSDQAKNRASGACYRQCGASCTSSALQIVVAIIFLVFLVWVASLSLEWVNLIGISSVPPGVRHLPYDDD